MSPIETIHPTLRAIVDDVSRFFPLKVICGYRNEADQLEAFLSGASKVKFPHSKHNSNPARAMDVAPMPINWKNEKAFHVLAGAMVMAGQLRGVSLVWGGSWGWDLGHFELPEDHP